MWLDVAAWSLADEASVYRHMGAALGAHCETREEVAALIDPHERLALVIDEADRLLGHPWTHSVFVWLRHLNDARFPHRLSFLLVGGPELWRYRNPHDNGSPALNTARWIFMEPLDAAARHALMDRLGQPIDRDALLAEAGGHPWLLTEILQRVWDGVELDEAIAQVAESGQRNFATWRGQLGEAGAALVRHLLSAPTPLKALRYRGDLWAAHGESWPIVRALCIADSHTDPVTPGPGMFLYWPQRRTP